jgi:hypothetical protein
MSIRDQVVKAQQELEPLLQTADFNTVVNVMCNHERNMWARSGYPGLRRKDPKGPAKFISPPKLLHRLQGRQV